MTLSMARESSSGWMEDATKAISRTVDSTVKEKLPILRAILWLDYGKMVRTNKWEQFMVKNLKKVNIKT